MEAVLIVLGAFLALAGSVITQDRQRKIDARTRLYLDLLPTLERQLRRYHRVADQRRDGGPHYVLAEDDWADPRSMQDVYRNAVVAGGRERALASSIQVQWALIDRAFDPEIGLAPTALVLGDETVRDASAAALALVADFTKTLEGRGFVARVRALKD